MNCVFLDSQTKALSMALFQPSVLKKYLKTHQVFSEL